MSGNGARIMRLGEWFIVEGTGAILDLPSGTYQRTTTPYGAFRSSHDANDLRQAILRAQAGDLKYEVWIDGPLHDEDEAEPE